MRTGSMVNLLIGNDKQRAPEVGMGGTILMWTDREPVTVIAILGRGRDGSPTRIMVREDTAIRTDSNGLSEVQRYEYTANPDGRVSTFTLRKNGAWVRERETMNGGTRLALGFRKKYSDPSF